MGAFEVIIRVFTFAALGIASMEVYLKVNKIWKRKHEREVAESQSITGLTLAFITLLVWFVYFLMKGDFLGIMDNIVYMVETLLLIMVSTGLWVKGQKRLGFWTLVKRAFKLERKEANYLLKKLFKPKNAEKIINMLHQLAMIDEELEPREQELIEVFANEWNIEYDAEKLNKERMNGMEINVMRLRNELADYLSTEPPAEQVAHLRDLMKDLIMADGVVTEEEDLIYSELAGIMGDYLDKDKKKVRYHVLVVPQEPEHEKMIHNFFPRAKKVAIGGGNAFSIGEYYTQKYAEMVCREQRKIHIMTIVHTPDEAEASAFSQENDEKPKSDNDGEAAENADN